MHLVFDIFQGLGIASAVGIRPFLPTLGAGGLAAVGVEISFAGTDYSFLQSAPFLIAMAVAAVVLGLLERQYRSRMNELGPLTVAVAAVAVVLGALLFAASLARGHYAAWPGYLGGVVCVAVAVAAIRPLLTRVGGRLDEDAAALLPLWVEAAALLLAVLSVVAPPIGLLGFLLLLWLAVAGRRRSQEKYAGLRILR